MNKQFWRGFSRGTSCGLWFMLALWNTSTALEYVKGGDRLWVFPAALAVVSIAIVVSLVLWARSDADDEN